MKHDILLNFDIIIKLNSYNKTYISIHFINPLRLFDWINKSLLLQLVSDRINEGVFKILHNINHLIGSLFVDNNIFQKPFNKRLHKFPHLSFHGPLLVNNPLLISFESLLLFLQLLKFSIVKFVNILKFILKVLIFLFSFCNGCSGYF